MVHQVTEILADCTPHHLNIGDCLAFISGPENLIESYCPMTTGIIAADEYGKVSGSQVKVGK
jgi:hypothetical protein